MSDLDVTIADLREDIATTDAKAAFDLIVDRLLASGEFTLAAHEQGFLNSLRIKRGEEFCFAAIPNEEWVLTYIRKPELRRGKITPDAALAEFPEARLSNNGEITLRIHDAPAADRWLRFIMESQG